MADQPRNKPEDPIEFTPERAWEIYEKHILVGLTYLDAMGEVVEYRQLHGDVIRAHPSEGIVLRLDNGSEYTLPPDFRPISKAPPGEYRLRSTGEVLLNPDYLATYTITRSYKQ